MKTKIFCIFLGLCLFAISPFSCDRVTEERIRSYVVSFFELNTIALELTENDNIVMYWREITRTTTYQSKGEDAAHYDALCAKYNDLGYNKKTRYIEYIGCREYTSNEIVSIDVVSNVDFDADHPAGASLGDIVHFLSVSPMRFIQSNYKETYDWSQQPPEFGEETFDFCYDEKPVDVHHHPVYGKLTELKQNDLQLLGQGLYSLGRGPSATPPDHSPGSGYFFGYLTFDKEPDVSDVHEITVTVLLADGRALSHTIEKTF